MRNWIRTTNPFNLAVPPLWFLQALHAYDAAFVIFASTSQPVYRMGRRGRYGTGLLSTLNNQPDTTIFVAHKVWPWKSVLPATLGGDWNRILLEIPDYDTQRFGNDPGAGLDESEARAEAAADRRMLNDLDAINSDTYRAMKLIEGSRVGAGSRPEGAGYSKLPQPKTARSRRASSRPRNYQSTGAMFMGR
jgi:hypothetical protein